MTESEHDRASEFADLPEDGFARIAGVDDDPSNWHINEHILMSTGDDSLHAILAQFADGIEPTPDADVTHALVFQRADASAEWLLVVVVQEDGEWHFKDHKLAGLTPGDYEDVDGELRVLDHDQNKANLSDE